MATGERALATGERSLDELKTQVVHALETNGVLGQIRAQLRANVYQAIDTDEEPFVTTSGAASRLRKSAQGRLMAEIVAEFFEFYDFRHSRSVFLPEASLPRERRSRADVACDAGLGQAVRNDLSILEQIVDQASCTANVLKGREGYHSSASSTTASSPPPQQLHQQQQLLQQHQHPQPLTLPSQAHVAAAAAAPLTVPASLPASASLPSSTGGARPTNPDGVTRRGLPRSLGKVSPQDDGLDFRRAGDEPFRSDHQPALGKMLSPTGGSRRSGATLPPLRESSGSSGAASSLIEETSFDTGTKDPSLEKGEALRASSFKAGGPAIESPLGTRSFAAAVGSDALSTKVVAAGADALSPKSPNLSQSSGHIKQTSASNSPAQSADSQSASPIQSEGSSSRAAGRTSSVLSASPNNRSGGHAAGGSRILHDDTFEESVSAVGSDISGGSESLDLTGASGRRRSPPRGNDRSDEDGSIQSNISFDEEASQGNGSNDDF